VDITYDEVHDNWIAVGGTKICTSNDCINWTKQTTPTLVVISGGIHCISSHNGITLLSAGVDVTMYSDDGGVTWTQFDDGNATNQTLEFENGDGRWVGVGSSGSISYAGFQSADVAQNIYWNEQRIVTQSAFQAASLNVSRLASELGTVTDALDSDINALSVAGHDSALTQAQIDSAIPETFSAFNFHLLPETNSQYDLGSAEYKIRHLYLSNNSLYLGDSAHLTASGTELSINGGQVITATNFDASLYDFSNLPDAPTDPGKLYKEGGFIKITE
ncbi:MAG: hypothetical protein VW270_13095, partial [Candidatus Poseidoniales archaeon]